jgi:hypothetical protein
MMVKIGMRSRKPEEITSACRSSPLDQPEQERKPMCYFDGGATSQLAVLGLAARCDAPGINLVLDRS